MLQSLGTLVSIILDVSGTYTNLVSFPSNIFDEEGKFAAFVTKSRRAEFNILTYRKYGRSGIISHFKGLLQNNPDTVSCKHHHLGNEISMGKATYINIKRL